MPTRARRRRAPAQRPGVRGVPFVTTVHGAYSAGSAAKRAYNRIRARGDLIYLDPPFNSQRDYNAIYKDETGRSLAAQIEAFGDMWAMNEERERELRTMPVLMCEAGIADESVEFWRLWMNALRVLCSWRPWYRGKRKS